MGNGSGTATPVTGAASGGGWSQVVAPVIEPISLTELKQHLKLDSETLAGNLTLNPCIPAGSHPVTEGYTLLGTAVEIIGKRAVVYLQPSNNGAGGIVDVKIQESDDGSTWTDWSGGAFTQVTEANDTAVQEKEYTGTKRYIRTAAKTLVAACEFGTAVLTETGETTEDDLLTADIITARIQVENDTRRQLISATWDYCLQAWPSSDRIRLPFGNLQSISYIKYKDSNGTETILTENTDYIVEKNGDSYGYAVLSYGKSWPSATLYPSNPISIRYVCGYGDTAANVPFVARAAIKLAAADLYQHRQLKLEGPVNFSDNKTYDRLINAVPRLCAEF